MIKNVFFKIFLFLLGFMPCFVISMEPRKRLRQDVQEQPDAPHTPQRKRARITAPDSPYIPLTPASVKKFARVKPSSRTVNKKRAQSWPRTLVEHPDYQHLVEDHAQQKKYDGTTLLHDAFRADRADCACDLLKAGAPLDASRGEERETPLHAFAASLWTTPTKIKKVEAALAQRQEDIAHVRNAFGSTPLHIICSKGLLNFEKFKVLAKAGASLTVQDGSLHTILHRLAQVGPDIQKHRVRILAYLESSHASAVQEMIDKKDAYGRTALWHAVNAGDQQMVEWLSRFADVDQYDEYENTPLHMAARNVGKKNKHASAIIRLLWAQFACPFLQNKAGNLPVDLLPQGNLGMRNEFERYMKMLSE